MPDEAQRWWNRNALDYQSMSQIPVDVIYGPGSPNEAELQLLGPVAGKHVLEIGCGGAQCSIAFAQQGAVVAAVDISATQLAFAQDLAAHHNAEIAFYQRSMDDLAPIQTGSQDIVFSAYAFSYVDDLSTCFREVHRVLRDDGLFVWSDVNPYFDLLDGQTLRPARSYFDTGKVVEGWDDAPFATNHRKLSDYFNNLFDSGFTVQRVLEPDSRRRYPYDPWYGLWDFTPESMALIPPTIIFKCRKR